MEKRTRSQEEDVKIEINISTTDDKKTEDKKKEEEVSKPKPQLLTEDLPKVWE